MSEKEAQAKIALARNQLDRVQTAAYAEDRVEAVTWAFYSYENAVVAAAEKAGIAWQKTHPSKIQAAGELRLQGILSIDVGDKLQELNELRKDVAYGEPGPDLEEVDVEDLASELEAFVEEVAAYVDRDDG